MSELFSYNKLLAKIYGDGEGQHFSDNNVGRLTTATKAMEYNQLHLQRHGKPSSSPLEAYDEFD